MIGQRFSAAILAGGAATRMGGANKAFLKLGSGRIVDRLISLLAPLFDEILLAVREPGPFQDLGVRVAVDRFKARCPLTGLHAALAEAEHPYVFVTSCDAPLLQADLVQALKRRITGRQDVVVPTRDGWYHYPLCAIYSRNCLPHVEAALKQGRHQLVRFFKAVRLDAVPLADLRVHDPDLLSLFNVNTPKDLAQAEELFARQSH